ncbi:hypothetical protein MKW98_009519 [Papaver atlanticum]|uniref:Vacuolar cation/proton exchanger n=1 Tax=Papaver atlanticum TaxID=357466 RepID=A0AAD4SHT5_9MAGN|nr:hypothetical protein MKW98_009519 [Papaver atlanticum]
MAGIEPWNHVENGGSGNTIKGTSREIKHGRTAHNMSSSSLRKKSSLSLIQKVKIGPLRQFLTNLQEVILGTKLFILFPAIPLAFLAKYCHFGDAWVFGLSLVALTPLAERLSFLTEQIAFETGPTIGGLLNATCGNATELIIAIFALYTGKIDVVKYSLLGSILSNLLLVLGTSLFCGGLANLNSEQRYDRKQADVNSLLLLMGLLCHSLPLMFRYASTSRTDLTANPTLTMSRVSCIIMLIAYIAYLFFQLKTHRQLFEAQEGDDDDLSSEEEAVIGSWSAFIWLAGMTVVIAFLSEFVVGTIEDASESWGISVSFISIILLPIVGNAAEHAGAVIFAFKNKLDITLGVALGSSTQISMFVIPLCVIVAWIMGIEMDLDFNLLETGSLALSVIITAFTLQDGTSHYLKGLVLLLCYFVIAACFFVLKSPVTKPTNFINMRVGSALSTARNLKA